MLNPIDILFVEDNHSDADLAIRALKKAGLGNRLLHLENGEEALEYLFATGKYDGRNMLDTPKVILLDIKMPKISGIEVLRKLKSDTRTMVIPVVLLTSSKEDKDIMECYRLGANSYIVKPVGFENFISAVSGLGMYWILANEAPVEKL